MSQDPGQLSDIEIQAALGNIADPPTPDIASGVNNRLVEAGTLAAAAGIGAATAWYMNRWFWALGGVVIAALLIFLAFMLLNDDDQSSESSTATAVAAATETALAESTTTETVTPTAAPEAPVIDLWEVDPGQVGPDQQITFSWKVTGATRIVIEPGIGEVGEEGTASTTIEETTTFQLVAENDAQTSERSTTVDFVPPTATPEPTETETPEPTPTEEPTQTPDETPTNTTEPDQPTPTPTTTEPDGTRVYIADALNNRIQVFDGTGLFILEWGSDQLNNPSGVAVDNGNNVYVVDSGNNRVQKYDSSGGLQTEWGSSGDGDGQFSNPLGIAVDGSGNVYVADSNNNRVQKFDSNGGFIAQWGSEGSEDGQFLTPQAVAVDGGNVFVTDYRSGDDASNRVQQFDSNGGLINSWGGTGTDDGQFQAPLGISNGLYVADSGNNRIQRFDGNGGFQTAWGSEGSDNGQFLSPAGVALGPGNAVFVLDTRNNRIQRFDANGGFQTVWGEAGNGPGQFGWQSGQPVNQAYGIAAASAP